MRRDSVKTAVLASAAALLLGACALGGDKAAPPAAFDLGPALAAASVQPPGPLPELHLSEMSAPPWLATTGIAYRLAYLDEFRPQYYRDSRWLAPPATLLSERLRQQLALRPRGASLKPMALRLELVEFEQRFSAPTQSEVRVSLRARLGEGSGVTQAFEIARPTRSNDAAGAVQAFSEASDAVLTQVLTWVALNAKP